MEDFFEELKNRPRLNIFRRIYLWWIMEGRFLPREIKLGVQKLWYWLPVIWKDRDWDTHFIYEVMKHKLKAQAKYIGDRDFHTRAQQDARRMRICVKLIEACQNDTYSIEYMKYMTNRSWFTSSKDNSEYLTWNNEITSERFNAFYKKYPLIYKRVMKGEGPFSLDGRDELDLKKVVAMNICNINQDRAHKLLFKIMEQNIQRWWD